MEDNSINNGTSTTPIFAFDFDGVLVDSAGETGQSGWLAAKTLWPSASWLKSDPQAPLDVLERFRQVRPCLETGWEAPLLVRVLADPAWGQPSVEEILQNFQEEVKPRLLRDLNLTPETCNEALKKARNDRIAENEGRDWIQAHDFFEGACQSVLQLLTQYGNENIFVITTKAKDFALRLLKQQDLYSETDDCKIKEEHIYGLGSGAKASVLADLLDKRPGSVAVMVEDNLTTLYKITATPELKGRVLPALASWGYNTSEEQQKATQDHFVVLNAVDSSSLGRLLVPEVVPRLLKDFKTKHYQ